MNFNFSHCFPVDKVGLSGGLALFWGEDLDVRFCSFNKYYIDVMTQEVGGAKWRFTSFYGDPYPKRRHLSWTLLRHLKALNNLLWLVEGDFNDILFMSEKKWRLQKSKSKTMNFHDALNDCALRDLGWSEGMFIWSNRQFREGLVQDQLD